MEQTPDADELSQLRAEVADLKSRLSRCATATGAPHGIESDVALSKAQAERYIRHITLRSFGPQAQARLCAASALIVGAGGLGCPCALHLAAAGIGRLGIIDQDTVSLDNLHRQVAHTQARVGMHKADSAATACREINPELRVTLFREPLSPQNAEEVCGGFDVVIDCSDNAPTRYLVNDACVLTGVPLVAGAAVGTEGQLTVYNHAGGPCYRCLFPECPAPQNCARCDEAGVLGPVPGAIGTLQATEAIKVLTRVGRPLSGRLLLYDALEATFRTVRLRGPRPGCAACCSSDAELRRCGGLREYDYHTFTGGQAMEEKQAGVALLRPEQRVSCGELRALLDSERSNGAADGGGGSGGKVVLVDVRPPELFAAGRLPGAVHVPMAQVDSSVHLVGEMLQDAGPGGQIVVVCRRGNDSQIAAQALLDGGLDRVRDLRGGLHAWAAVNGDMPVL